MEDEYGMGDLRHYMSSRPLFPPNPIAQPPEFRGLNGYDMLVFRSDSTANASNTTSASAAAAASFSGFNCGSNGGGRWPRQETLTLLEIRSRLDPKFKEANQKGPLWDEVSRIMSEEYGYQRSGKKCREKFENLYKYYKKTKEGKAGRQDGKHYRFFRQLEALYGEANTSSSMSEPHPAAGATYLSKFSDNLARNHESIQCPKLSDTSLSLSNYSGGNSSSSDGNDPNEGINDHGEKMKKLSRWKVKVKDFIDAQMKKLMEKQETWMERMMRTIEDKERERMMREEEWRKQEVARMEREQKFWANERAWIEARDVALMEALHKLAGKESRAEEAMAAEIRSLSENQHDDGSETITNAAKGGDLWPECGINRTKMAAFGHDRSKEKWDNVNNYAIKCSKKRKEDSKSCIYFHSHESIFNCDTNDHHPIIQNHDQVHVSSSPNPNSVGAISESCFRYFMGDAYGRI